MSKICEKCGCMTSDSAAVCPGCGEWFPKETIPEGISPSAYVIDKVSQINAATIKDKFKSAAGKAAELSKVAAEKAKVAAGGAAEKAKVAAEKAKVAAGDAAEKAKVVAGEAAEKAKVAADAAKTKAGEAADSLKKRGQ